MQKVLDQKQQENEELGSAIAANNRAYQEDLSLKDDEIARLKALLKEQKENCERMHINNNDGEMSSLLGENAKLKDQIKWLLTLLTKSHLQLLRITSELT